MRCKSVFYHACLELKYQGIANLNKEMKVKQKPQFFLFFIFSFDKVKKMQKCKFVPKLFCDFPYRSIMY